MPYMDARNNAVNISYLVRVADVGHARALAGADAGDGPALARHHDHLGTDVVANQQSEQNNQLVVSEVILQNLTSFSQISSPQLLMS